MSKSCERPGCSNPGEAAYGMIPEDLLFWIEGLDGHPADTANVLCRRHADSMVVPRGWTLDDRRNGAGPRLFQPARFATAPPATEPPAARRPRRSGARPEQLQLDGTGEIPRPAAAGVGAEASRPPDAAPTETAARSGGTVAERDDTAVGGPGDAAQTSAGDGAGARLGCVAGRSADGDQTPTSESAASSADAPDRTEPDDARVGEWRPDFAVDDDLDGLLDVSSPLLSRAFRGTDLPR